MSIRTFDSIEDMFAAIEAGHSAADAATQPWQRALDEGDCFIQDVGIGIPVFAQIERSDIPEDKPIEDRMWARNQRPIRAWSAMCPRGELGTAHVASALLKVDPLVWVMLLNTGWPTTLSMFAVRNVDGVPTLCMKGLPAQGEA